VVKSALGLGIEPRLLRVSASPREPDWFSAFVVRQFGNPKSRLGNLKFRQLGPLKFGVLSSELAVGDRPPPSALRLPASGFRPSDLVYLKASPNFPMAARTS